MKRIATTLAGLHCIMLHSKGTQTFALSWLSRAPKSTNVIMKGKLPSILLRKKVEIQLLKLCCRFTIVMAVWIYALMMVKLRFDWLALKVSYLLGLGCVSFRMAILMRRRLINK